MRRLQRPFLLRLINVLRYDEPRHSAKEATKVRKHLQDSELSEVPKRKPKEPKP